MLTKQPGMIRKPDHQHTAEKEKSLPETKEEDSIDQAEPNLLVIS